MVAIVTGIKSKKCGWIKVYNKESPIEAIKNVCRPTQVVTNRLCMIRSTVTSFNVILHKGGIVLIIEKNIYKKKI